MRSLLALLMLAPNVAAAQAWTRDQGSAYLELGLQTMAGDRVYGPDFESRPLASTYRQLSLSLYGEVGLVDRWLTLGVGGEIFRRNQLDDQGATRGLGDLRLGLFSGLLTAPVRVTAGLWVGLPTGDDRPTAGASADPEAELIARSLPTGDGELDLEPTVLVGTSFGGGDWPFDHYAVAALAYSLRTRGFADAIRYRAELGTRVRAPILGRLWLTARIHGLESFASQAEAAADFSGLGNGVSFLSLGVSVSAKIWSGLGASIGADTAVRARSIIAAIPLRFALSWEL